jgi:pimeloyl-ACP methyl ester carboxylesterase
LVGFSFGGGYSVLAASGCAKPPRFVVSVSGHADLSALFRYWETWGAKAPHGAEARKSWIYQKLALAWRQRDALAIPETRQAQLREILLSFCDEGSADAAWSFYEQALRTTNGEAENRLRQEPAVLRALSPAAHPLRLGCPVVILHDKTDQAVPASEATIMAEAIARGSPTISVDILVTDLLRHVSLGPAFRLGEVVRLFRLLSPLVRG